MRFLAIALLSLIAALQWPLWFGKGGWAQVWKLDREITTQRETNDRLRARNAALDAEVRDLKTGYDAIEERARNDLGMVKPGETFFQVIEPGRVPAPLK